jgi:1,4-alpha-glucan branching enzyme
MKINPPAKMKTIQKKTQSIKAQSARNVNRKIQFAFPAPTARQVSLAGDFNNWDTKAGPMQKAPDGVWRLNVALMPGRYEYRFFADEVWCDDPAALQKAVNPLGTENCVRIV